MSDWVALRDALGLTLRPIDEWPGKPRFSRDRGPFTAPLKDTLQTLRRELRELGARKIVLQVAFREQDFRLDGLPRANAVATHPGVILAFEAAAVKTPDGRPSPMRIYFDAFTRWENNLRAIAMHLEHLRLAGLYGVGADGQQYRGWVALPPPEKDGFDTAEAAAEFIARHAGVGPAMAREILADPEALTYYYRIAARKLHPDAGGDHDQFVRLQNAVDILRKGG